LKKNTTSSDSERIYRYFLNAYIPTFSIFFVFVIFHTLYLGTTNFYEIWSFKVQDPPWMPDNLQANRILGNHFFGDFQLPYGAAYIENGYKGDFVTILPFGFLLYKIATLFSLQSSFILFTLIGFCVYYRSIYIWVAEASNLRHLLAFILTFMSIPLWVALDRGALSFLTVGLLGIVLKRVVASAEKNTKNRIKITWYDAILVALVISWKIYFIIPFFLIFLFSFKEFCKKILFTLFTSNFIASFIVAGSPLFAIKGLMNAYFTQAGDGNPGWIFGGVSLSKFFASLYWYSHTYEQSMEFAVNYRSILMIPGLIFVAYLVFRFAKTERITANLLVAALSTSFLIIPVAGTYTLVVCALCIGILLRECSVKNEMRSVIPQIMLIVVCGLSMLPWPTHYYLTLIPFFWITLPILLALLGFFKKTTS
jgi:hypothetical protein